MKRAKKQKTTTNKQKTEKKTKIQGNKEGKMKKGTKAAQYAKPCFYYSVRTSKVSDPLETCKANLDVFCRPCEVENVHFTPTLLVFDVSNPVSCFTTVG